VPFPTGTLTIGLAAGDMALQQRVTQGLLRPGQIYGQPAAGDSPGPGWRAWPTLDLLSYNRKMMPPPREMQMRNSFGANLRLTLGHPRG
jgi:hypothetical protein